MKSAFEQIAGMSRAQMGEIILSGIEALVAPKEKPLYAVTRLDKSAKEDGVPLKDRIVYCFASYDAALEKLKEQVQIEDDPNIFFDIEEVPAVEEEEEAPIVRPGRPATPEEIALNVAKMQERIKDINAYYDKRRFDYETAVVALGRPMDLVEYHDWQNNYPAPVFAPDMENLDLILGNAT